MSFSPNDKCLTLEEVDLYLKYIVKKTRDSFKMTDDKLLRNPLVGQCINASGFIIRSFWRDFNGLDFYQLRTNNVFTSTVGHCFVVVYFNTIDGDKAYVIDPTYRQFCLLSYCNPSRLYHYDPVIMPGYFVQDVEMIKKLLKDGYFEINEYNAKIYGDSFVLATRTADSKEIVSKSEITGKQYVKALIYGDPVK